MPEGVRCIEHLPEVIRPVEARWSIPVGEPFREATCTWVAGVVREGLALFAELPRGAKDEVLLATDLHAGNLLRAQREPWLAIDPKPFLGERCYDATQHLFNCRKRLSEKPDELIRRLADLLAVDDERIRLWTFARAAAEPRANWRDRWMLDLARQIAP